MIFAAHATIAESIKDI